jgi:hypothetical protein
MTDFARIALASVLIALCGPLTAVAYGHSVPRRTAALVIAGAGQAIPFVLPESWHFLRALYTLAAFVSLLRVIDLWRDPKSYPLPERLWLLTALFDTRRIRRAEPSLDWQRFAKVAGYAAAMGVGLAVAYSVDANGPWRWLRWLGGAVFVYAMVDTAARFADAAYRSAGIIIPPQHDNPVLSRSVSEFWGKRWNLNVHDWLRRHCFLPFAKNGHARVGIVAGFLASAILHFWMVYVPLGLYWAIPMGLFFMAQAALMGIERVLRVRQWPRAAQHGWTVIAVLGTSPLFVEPFLQIIHAT